MARDTIITVADKLKMAAEAGITFPHYTNTDNPIDFPMNNRSNSMLYHATGNLLDLAENFEFDVIVQGCNCFNTMGGGIAKEIREKYPSAAAADRATKHGDYNKLGNWSLFDTGRFVIVNAYTQYDMSTGQDVFEYAAFELICQKLYKQYGDRRIGLPYIGMGLAGGDKNIILEQIEHFASLVASKGGAVTLVEFG